jgi:hypothetical protein
MSNDVKSAVAPAEEGAEEAAGGDESSSSDVSSDEDDADLPDEPADEDLSDGNAVSEDSDSEGEGGGEEEGEGEHSEYKRARSVLSACDVPVQ